MALRAVAKIPDTDSWGSFQDCISAIATIIEGVESLTHPQEMQKRLQQVWQSCAEAWRVEHERIILECLGGTEEVQLVKSHPNGKNAIGRILERVREIHGGRIMPGMDMDDVEVGDILSDEQIIL